jgi:hypothetical protein
MTLAKDPKAKEDEENKHSNRLTRSKRIQSQGCLQHLLLANKKLKLSMLAKNQ